MARDRQAGGPCPKCGEDLYCSYNHFQDDQQVIDTWEHMCPNCGHRDTKAFRAEASDGLAATSRVCPYCGRQGEIP